VTPLEIVRSAVANTFRSKVRTALTVLAIFVGAFTLTITSGIGTGVTEYIDAQVASLGATDAIVVTRGSGGPTAAFAQAQRTPAVYNPERAFTTAQGGQVAALTDADIARLRDVPGITSAEPLRAVTTDFVSLDDGTRYVFPINPTPVTRAELAAGRQVATSGPAREVLLPERYLEVLGFATPADAVGRTVTIGISDARRQPHEVEAEIVGVQRGTLLDVGALTSPGLTAALYEAQTTGLPEGFRNVYVGAIARFTAGPGAEDAVKAGLRRIGLRGTTVEDQLGRLRTAIDAIVSVLNGFAIIALLAAGFGIVNTLLMAVQERTREIGLMKSMGMARGRIFALFSAEAAFIGLLGSSLGALAGMGAGTLAALRAAEGPLRDLPGLRVVAFDPAGVLSMVAIVMALAFVAGTLPAARAAALDPIEALRYE